MTPSTRYTFVFIYVLNHLAISLNGQNDITVYTFLSSCNSKEGLDYNFNNPIQLDNSDYQWPESNSLSTMSECYLNINLKQTSDELDSQTSFIVRFELDTPMCESSLKTKDNILLLSIIDHKTNLNNSNSSYIYVVNDVNLCEQINNYLLINASHHFQLKLFESSNKNNINSNTNNNPYALIKSITISSFEYTDTKNGSCKNDQFQCINPSNVCLNLTSKCNLIKSCADGSDEFNCYNDTDIISSTTMSTSVKTSLYNSTISSVINSTVSNLDKPEPPEGHTLSFFIGLLIILTIITSILIGVWLYGRRRRKWREFLAQLDNNTDWEYEQLDDGPVISSSRTTMTPVFDITMPNEHNSHSGINNNNTGNRGVNERTPIHYNA